MFQVTRLLHLFQIRPAAAQNLLKMSSQHSHNLRRIIINTAAAPGAIGPYNQVLKKLYKSEIHSKSNYRLANLYINN
jgi:hypothetical protein